MNAWNQMINFKYFLKKNNQLFFLKKYLQIKNKIFTNTRTTLKEVIQL